MPGSGRPKGVVAMIRESTDDGWELIRLALRIARGEPFKDARGRGIRRPKDAVQLEAIRWLGDRVWGRIPVADGNGEGPEVIILRMRPDQDF